MLDFLDNVRKRINDTDKAEFDDYELIDFLNNAIDYLSLELIGQRDRDIVKRKTITPDMTVPSDFHSFAGVYPVSVEEGKFKFLENIESLEIRYCAIKPIVDETTDEIPFTQTAHITYLLQLTSMFALNRIEFNLQQDMALFNMNKQLLGGTKK